MMDFIELLLEDHEELRRGRHKRDARGAKYKTKPQLNLTSAAVLAMSESSRRLAATYVCGRSISQVFGLTAFLSKPATVFHCGNRPPSSSQCSQPLAF